MVGPNRTSWVGWQPPHSAENRSRRSEIWILFTGSEQQQQKQANGCAAGGLVTKSGWRNIEEAGRAACMRAALRAAYRAFWEELQLQQEAKPALCCLICCDATKDEAELTSL